MNHKDQDHILIQQYLDGSLKGDARKQLERRLEQEPELQRLLDLYKDIDSSLSNDTVRNYRRLIKDLQEERKGKEKKRVLWPKHLLLAAAIALVAIFFVWIYTSQKASTPNTLFAENFNPETQLTLPKPSARTAQDSLKKDSSESSVNHPRWTLAIQRYQEGQLAEAIKVMEQVPENTREQYATTYYLQLGLLYIKDQQFKEGISTLEKIADSSNEAEWNMALAWLKVDVKQAKSLLRKISKVGKYKSKEAEKMLQQLE